MIWMESVMAKAVGSCVFESADVQQVSAAA